jgi:hypothetical protein
MANPFDTTSEEYERKRKALEEAQGGYDTDGAIQGALASFGAAFQGKDSMAASNQVVQQRAQGRKDEVSELDKWYARETAKVKAKQDATRFNREETDFAEKDAKKQSLRAGDSAETQSLRQLAKQMIPSFKGFDSMTGEQIQERLPILEKIMENQFKSSERAQDRRIKEEQMAASKADRERKAQELSGVEAKQRGLFESGQLAEGQYAEAVSDPNDFDPTENFQIFDNSPAHGWIPNFMKNDKAIKAKAAESAWVESFLRDASGAAIPPSERGAYAVDFFPQPSDPPEVVANKAALRKQKMENARVGAGGDAKGVYANVKVMTPDGRVKMIPKDKLQEALNAGGKLVDSMAAR